MKKIVTIFAFLGFTISSFAQVGIGTVTPDASAALDISSTNKGVLVPRMTQAQRNLIGTPATGLLIYQTDATPGFYYYNGASWQSFASSGWSLTGNGGTTPTSNKVGTTDAQDFKIVTNNIESLRVTSGGNVGIGTSTPSTKLHVAATSVATQLLNDGFEDGNVAPFTTGGNRNWTTGAPGFSGTTAAKTRANLVDNENSWLETTATIGAQGGTISFAYSTSTESCCDKLRFLIDGVEQANWGGIISWTTVTYNLTSGTHTFRWNYTKDSSADGGTDEVFLDDVIITENASPTLTIQDGAQGVGKMLYSDATGLATWKNPIAVSTTDDDWRWQTGTSNSDPIYHVGNIKVGQSTASTYNLHLNNGSASGTQAGIGTIEYIQDGVDEFNIYCPLSPITNNSINAGSGTKRWTAVYAATGTINTSDRRDKENIQPLRYGINEIMKMEPVSFKWKKENESGFEIPDAEKETKLGFIAQQIQPILPEVIETHQWKEYEEKPGILVKEEMPRLGISYTEIIPVAIKAIQDQQLQIDALKKQKEALEKIVKTLENNKKGAN
ncbi:tail fiber domain-containing protein [Flavobacterium amnicola]|uniref:Tail fiber domain-containing protein n=1 Tax=Flavobacterium amnicola TaxID=2506422 RepID=A0A4Q1K4W6_9FLAO|nr:tail fiber domain-containing protein [Flavobacterium amnicola]RXR20923.1 tail fiber domain-containing protein [Flavobacterium amnicola]